MPAFDERTTTAAAEKRAIGRATAALLEDGDTVLLDGGTTTLEVARALLGRPDPGRDQQPADRAAAGHPARRTTSILIGGYVYPRTGVALGPLAIAMMQGIRVRKAILGAGGIMPEGIYNSNLLLVETERQMMECGQEVVIVADHSKFGRLALAQLCGLDEIHHVVVDPGLPDEYRAILEAAGVEIHLAPLEAESKNGAVNGRAADRRPEDRSMSTAVSRDQVEELVRSIIRQQLGDGTAGPGPPTATAYRPRRRRQHLGQALPPDAGGRRRPLRRGLPAHRR